MTSVTISQLKSNPSAVLSSAADYPVAVQNRNKTAGYILGKEMFEKLILLVEDIEDRKAIEDADYKHGTSLDDLIEELGLK